MTKDLYQHFHPSDREFIDRGTELLQRVEDAYVFESTAFLNPHQVSILKNISKRYDVQLFVSSDYFPSELAKVIVAPPYYQLNWDDFDLALLEIVYASKFNKLTHAQIMGTLLNQLGIERRIFGDILAVGERAQIFVDRRFVQFFMDQVTKIAKVPVKLKETAFENQILDQRPAVTRDILVSSLRLDKLIASAFKLSRSQASQLIAGRHVKVNYAVSENHSQQILLDDLISVRRFGRFKVLSENGFSKNGKYKLTVELLSSK